MNKSMGLVALSVVVAFFGTACEIYHDGDCDDWENCSDYCYDGCGDDWDVDWEDDWDDWEDDWDNDWDNHDDEYCTEKLECLEDCTAVYEQSGEVIEAVLCYSGCFFSFDDCLPSEHTFDDPCDDSYNVCMSNCHQDMGCASSQMECFDTCESVRDTCHNGSGQNPPNTSDDTPVDPPATPSCKDTYDSCVDGCEWDQWICHENCYESFYECMEDEEAGEPASGDGSGSDDDIC